MPRRRPGAGARNFGTGLAYYRFLVLTLAAPILLIRLALSRLRGRESAEDIAQRLGAAPVTAARGPVVWLHGASVGELASARPLAETMIARDPRLRLVVTANTLTGRAQAQGWALDRTEVRLAPLDLRWVLKRFLNGWQPTVLLTIENEIWPNRMALARARHMPVVLAGARLSERSARVWHRFPALAREVLRLIDHAAPLDPATGDRLEALGLPRRRIGAVLNLKAAMQPAAPDAALLARYTEAFPREDTVLAASTHPGEEEIVLAAFQRARTVRPGLRLILAPRHPERGDEIAALIRRTGLSMRRRSAGEEPDADTAIYLADTMGEMALWYRLAPVCFLGGSLVDRGGHTPFEPAQAGSVILTGPDATNHGAAFAALAAAGASVEVRDAETLSSAILRLLAAPGDCRVMADRGRAALTRLAAEQGGLEDFLARLADLTGNAALTGHDA